jgi:iron complex transport system permease protein
VDEVSGAAPSVARRVLEAGGLVGPASLGALGALLATQLLGTRRDGPDPLTLVLAGVVISAMCGAATLFVQHLLPHAARGDLSTWMMGRIPEAPDRWLLGTVAGLAALGLLAGALVARALDAATFGDDEARALGVRLGLLRAGMATSAGVLAAGSVAIAGPLAFVGLMAPHIARLLLGARHRPLMFGAALVGAALLIAADVLRQSIDVGAGRIPVGVFTALAGGPLFLLLLQRGRGRP